MKIVRYGGLLIGASLGIGCPSPSPVPPRDVRPHEVPKAQQTRTSNVARGRVAAAVRRIIKEVLDVDEKDIKLESTLVHDLGADSVASIELIMSFEEAFAIDIPEDDAAKIKTVGDAVVYIEKRVSN